MSKSDMYRVGMFLGLLDGRAEVQHQRWKSLREPLGGKLPLRGSKGFSSLGIPTGKPPRGLLGGSAIFSGSGLVVPLRR